MSDNLPAKPDEVIDAEDAGTDEDFDWGPELIRQKVSLGTDELRREEPIQMGDDIFLVVHFKATGDGRKIDSDGLVYTAAGDANVKEIAQAAYHDIVANR